MKIIATGSSGFRLGRRRGAVMIEFVMVIPLLASILGFTFFFGWAMVNQQHVKIADRFQTWRRVRVGSHVNATTLNKRLFQGHLDEYSYIEEHGTSSEETRKTLEGLVMAAGMQSPQAETLARPLVMDRSPRGRWTSVYGRFPSEIGIFQQIEDYQGAIQHTHMRDGKEWRWRQIWCEPVIADEFLFELDSTLKGVSSPGNGLAEMARQLYFSKW